MAQKLIIWSKRAESEFRSILKYYVDRNGNTRYSSKIVDATEKLFDLLLVNNYMGRLSDNQNTRVINIDVFLIFYDLFENQIEIVSFWDNRQNPEKRIDRE